MEFFLNNLLIIFSIVCIVLLIAILFVVALKDKFTFKRNANDNSSLFMKILENWSEVESLEEVTDIIKKGIKKISEIKT